MNKLIKIGISVLFLSLSTIACQPLSSPPQQEPAKEKTPPIPASESNMFVVYDGSLNKKLYLNKVVTKPAGNLLIGMVEIQNKDFATLKMEYRFAWYDADGFEIEPDARAWQAVVMPPEAIKTLKTTSPQQSGTNFKVFVKEN